MNVQLPAASAPAAVPPPGAADGVLPLDPRDLVERSRIERPVLPAWPVLVVGVVALLMICAPSDGPYAGAFQVAAPLLVVAGWGAATLMRSRLGARLAAETQAVVALDELIQLRRWPEAADLTTRLLSRPMLMPDRRLTTLMSLATILGRYHRFADARVVHEYLLGPADDPIGPRPDGPTAHAIRVARAMTMLREDHLVDADRAMNDLRREVNRTRDIVRRESGGDSAREVRSAGLILLDLYRDVKTGHFAEVRRTFAEGLPTLREQIGVRVADAWLLKAAADYSLGDSPAAAEAYLNATALTPAVELHRRYPETLPLRDVFPAAPRPASTGRAPGALSGVAA